MPPVRNKTANLLLWALLASGALACATSQVGEVHSEAQGLPQTKPSAIFVYDFAVSAGDVVVDTFGPEFATGPGNADERTVVGRQVADSLAQHIVDGLIEHDIAAARGAPGEMPPPDSIVFKGQFLTVDEGDAAKRMTIGFGAGKSELRVQVQVYRATPQGLVRLAEAEASASGSKLPGMAVPVAGGAVAGTAATSAVISAGMNLTREFKGKLEPDTENLAEEIVDRVVKYYEERGWR